MPILALIIVVVLVGMVLSSAWRGVIILTIVAVTGILGVMFFVAVPFMNNAIERSLMAGMGIIFLIPLAYKSYHWLQASDDDVSQATSQTPVERTLSDDEVFAVSAHILALGKKTGCGSFEVTSRDRIGKYIEVKCYDGRSWRLENGAMLKINGNVVGF